MKNLFSVILIFFVASSLIIPTGSKEILQKMHNQYVGKWYKTLSFNQTTEVYHNDSLVKSQIWYEHIKFPANFRIDFGNPDNGNAVIFKNDSSFSFKSAVKANVQPYKDDLLFLLGGMYFYEFNTVLSKMKSFGYNLDKYHEDNWKGRSVYVIGAKLNEDSVNQLWIDKEKLYIVRMIKFEEKFKEEALFENQVKSGEGYTETQVHFFINNKLVQVEKYHDIKANISIEENIFNPENFVKLKL